MVICYPPPAFSVIDSISTFLEINQRREIIEEDY